MTGPLTLALDPVAPLQAMTKQYADLRLNRGGDTMMGLLQLAGDPVAPLSGRDKRIR